MSSIEIWKMVLKSLPCKSPAISLQVAPVCSTEETPAPHDQVPCKLTLLALCHPCTSLQLSEHRGSSTCRLRQHIRLRFEQSKTGPDSGREIVFFLFHLIPAGEGRGRRPAGRKHTRCNNTDDNCVSRKIVAILFSRWFPDVNCVKRMDRSSQLWRCFGNVYVLLHVREDGDCPVFWR